MFKAKRYARFAILAFLTILTSCSGDSESEEVVPEVTPPAVTTLQPEDINNQGATLRGKVTGEYSNNFGIGVCWSTNHNPTVESENAAYTTGVSGDGLFDAYADNYFEHGVTYYFRAFATSVDGTTIIYGNEVSLTREMPLTVLPVHEILTKSAVLRGHITQADDDYTSVGFVYSTSPNPTINDEAAFLSVEGTDDYQKTITGLQYNTTYYVRPYMIKPDSDGFIYGEETQFKTVGYTGPGGGYVVYDKGESIDGWRYLEIYPETLSYDINYSTGALWSTSQNFISGLSKDFGTGLENSEIIAANVSTANCAAKVCLNYVKNGKSDWFLGSADEMVQIFNTLKTMNIMLDGCWTSSQYNATRAYSTNYTGGTWTLSDLNAKYTNYFRVYPIRRYN